ncbi:hypothetical protein H6F46_06140 [Limnothrix sp. FACHB-1083]|uniref:hypothetical protein n=1 Tax=unclassified Limnothrix TaxID=2632864 RepID=UPI0016809C18|nr:MULTISPECIES: hypothetical protein [unclassified Limnothrix]MBD2160272.1 hypothetical protein [Limnothrix sp. FACHB-1083]MBD2190975.1 hypothetical protein [Limnothrix sp. FACHB-1088]
MTTETRLNTLEAQLQQLTINVTTLASVTTQQSFDWNQRFSHLAELTAANTQAITTNTQAIGELRLAINGLQQAIEGLNNRITQLEQIVDDRTDTFLGLFDQTFARIDQLQAASFARMDQMQGDINTLKTDVTGLKTDVTGLKTEIQRVIEILGEMRQ